MRCLLYNFLSSNKEAVKEHYISYHRIDLKNYFFNCLFNFEYAYLCKECFRCGEFLVTKEERASHNFLNHYELGKETPTEEKPVKIINNGELIIYQISYNEHKQYYDFYDVERIVDELLFHVKNLFKPSIPCQFKADFAIENKQDAPEGIENTADIKTLRYWTANVYFNSFVVAGIRQDILRRVINHRPTGSSWYFSRFSHLNIKVLKTKVYIGT